jgi:hypothetical protein
MNKNQNELISVRKARSSLSLNNVHILEIGTSNPLIASYKKEVLNNVMPEYINSGITDSDRKKLEQFYENCGIEKRYCHDNFSKKTFTDNIKGEYYNTKYKRIAHMNSLFHQLRIERRC